MKKITRLIVNYALLLLFAAIASGQDIIINVPVSQPRLLELDTGEDITTDDPGKIILGQDVSVVGGTPEYAYTWTDPDDNVHDGQNLSGQTFGKYYLMVTDDKNCTVVDSVSILNNTLITTKKEIGYIDFFPNPSTEMFHFPATGLDQVINVKVITTAGKTLITKQILNTGESGYLQIDLSNLVQGAYYIQLDDGMTRKMGLIILN